MLLRYIKSAMVGLIDLFFSLVAITNLKDFSSNLPAVQHVLSMDTTFHAPALMKRAVTSPYVQLGIYYFIVAWELLTATLCWLGCFRLLFSVNASNA